MLLILSFLLFLFPAREYEYDIQYECIHIQYMLFSHFRILVQQYFLFPLSIGSKTEHAQGGKLRQLLATHMTAAAAKPDRKL